MSNVCPTAERVKSFTVNAPTTVGASVAIDNEDFHVITAYNETDKPVQVNYSDVAGNACNFIVPANGRVFTRIMHNKLLYTSLFVKAIGADATGFVYINLGN